MRSRPGRAWPAAHSAGAAAGAFTGGFAAEASNAILEAAGDAGVDLADAEQVRAFFMDERKVEAARVFAVKRGLPVALFDGATAGVAGKFLGKALGKGLTKVGLATAAELGTQAAGGALGEAAAQVATGQELSLKSIAAEAIGELGGAPSEIVTNLRGELKRRKGADNPSVAEIEALLNAVPPVVNEFGGVPEGSAPVPARAADALPSAEQPVPAQPLAVTMIADERKHPVVEVPLEQLSLSQDVPNFKAEADEATGVVAGQQLEGEYQRLGTGAITVWERSDGRKEVISGRHRFDLARRAGELTVPAQIVREADGFNQADAMTLDAEMNIRDGQGSVADYANYFRLTDFTEAQARQRGLLSRAKGRAGWVLGRNAGEDLFALYRAGKVTEAQAVAVATAAPGEGVLQQAGSRLALRGAAPDVLQNFIQAVRYQTVGQSTEQLDLFGKDDAALFEAEKLAKTATALRRNLEQEIKATENAARRADQAQKRGIRFERDPAEILAENDRLRAEAERWANWPLHPDLVEKVTGRPAGGIEWYEEDIEEAGGGGPSGTGLSVDKVKAIVGKLSQRLPGLPRINVVATAADLPAGYQVRVAEKRARGRLTPAFYDGGVDEVWMIAGLLKNEAQAQVVALHESLGHGGMQKLLTEQDYNELLAAIRDYKPEAAARLVSTRELDLAKPADRRTFVNEFVADQARVLDEQHPLWRRVVDILLRSVRRMFGDPGRLFGSKAGARVLDAQMRGLARRAAGQLSAIRRQVREGLDRTQAQAQAGAPPEFQDLEFSQEEGAPERPLRQYGARVLESSAVPSEVRAGVSEYRYEPRSNESDREVAARVIDELGVDGAVAAYKDERTALAGPVRSILGDLLTERLAGDQRRAEAAGNRVESDELTRQMVELIDHDLRRSTQVAQALQALRRYGMMSTAGLVRHARNTIQDAAAEAMQGMAPALDAVAGGLRRVNAQAVEATTMDPAVQAAARGAVDEAVAGSEAVHRGIVLELTEPWASSPTILNHARAAARAKADQLLNTAPRPPGLSPSQHLRVILDDLAARAASIAAGHYQGAEPGVVLRNKLMERLGLSQEHAARLARQLDAEFTKQVEAAKAKLDKRIAEARARQLAREAELATDSVVDRAIRGELRKQQQRLGEVIREAKDSQDAARRTLGERIVAESGLTGVKADRLKAAVDRRFNALATAAKRKALEAMGRTIAVPRRVKELYQKLIEATNLGAFDNETVYSLVRERYGLPQWTPEVAAEITKRAAAIQMKPDGFQRQRAVVDLLNHVARQKGMRWWELPMAFWYANILSGPFTHVKNVLGNLYNLSAFAGLQMARRPQDVFALVRDLGRGAVKGAAEARAVLETGVVTGTRLEKFTASRPLELKRLKGRWDYVLTPWRAVGRALAAEDLLFYKTAEELRSGAAARVLARSEGLRGEKLQARVDELLGRGETRRLAAQAQAHAEGLSGLDARRRVNEILEQQRPESIREQARAYALRATFNQKPEGVLGILTEHFNAASTRVPALKLAVPFTNIIANVANESLMYVPPVGAYRAWKGYAQGEMMGRPVEQGEVFDTTAKAVLGATALAGLAALAAKHADDDDPVFAIYGAGPRTKEQRDQLKQTGWRPYTIKLHGKFYNYQQSPLAIPVSWLGHYLDAKRWKNLNDTDALNRVAVASMLFAKTLTDQSWLDGVAGVFQAYDREPGKNFGQSTLGQAARTASGFVIPNAVKQIEQVFDPAVYDAAGVQALLLSQVPWARRENRPALNVLGEPVTSERLRQFVSEKGTDALWSALAKRQLFISGLAKDTMLGDRVATPEEHYELTKVRGQWLGGQLRQPQIMALLETLPREEALKMLDAFERDATGLAKAKLRSERQ